MRIRDRPKAGAWLGFALSVLFAAVMVPLTTGDLWRSRTVDEQGRAILTVRMPEMGVWRDTLVGSRFEHKRVTVPRGTLVDASEAGLIQAYEKGRRPPSLGLLLGL